MTIEKSYFWFVYLFKVEFWLFLFAISYYLKVPNISTDSSIVFQFFSFSYTLIWDYTNHNIFIRSSVCSYSGIAGTVLWRLSPEWRNWRIREDQGQAGILNRGRTSGFRARGQGGGGREGLIDNMHNRGFLALGIKTWETKDLEEMHQFVSHLINWMPKYMPLCLFNYNQI